LTKTSSSPAAASTVNVQNSFFFSMHSPIDGAKDHHSTGCRTRVVSGRSPMAVSTSTRQSRRQSQSPLSDDIPLSLRLPISPRMSCVGRTCITCESIIARVDTDRRCQVMRLSSSQQSGEIETELRRKQVPMRNKFSRRMVKNNANRATIDKCSRSSSRRIRRQR